VVGSRFDDCVGKLVPPLLQLQQLVVLVQVLL
jgi:hypothetical protein